MAYLIPCMCCLLLVSLFSLIWFSLHKERTSFSRYGLYDMKRKVGPFKKFVQVKDQLVWNKVSQFY